MADYRLVSYPVPVRDSISSFQSDFTLAPVRGIVWGPTSLSKYLPSPRRFSLLLINHQLVIQSPLATPLAPSSLTLLLPPLGALYGGLPPFLNTFPHLDVS